MLVEITDSHCFLHTYNFMSSFSPLHTTCWTVQFCSSSDIVSGALSSLPIYSHCLVEAVLGCGGVAGAVTCMLLYQPATATLLLSRGEQASM